jgi:YHS domain-containing protein
MFVTMALAALVIDGLFSLFDIVPSDRPSTEDVFGSIEVDYKLVLNAVAAVVFCVLFWLTVRRGATDPVCGMKVDRAKALTAVYAGRTFHFCSEGCRSTFQSDPERYARPTHAPSEARVATHAH